MEIQERRALIITAPNPNPKLDYVTGFEGHIDISVSKNQTEVVLRYVPDRLILDAASFDNYLRLIEQIPWNSLEELAVSILDDIRNELIGRWTQITIKSNPANLSHLHGHSLTLEDYQPNWDNEELLAHLPIA